MLFSVELAAVDAARNCRRRYRIEVVRDLFGACIVSITFGRIAAKGRTIVKVAASEDETRRLVAALIRRRASLPQRIGVAYQVLTHVASDGWQSLPVELQSI